jgi:beta-glucosidase
MIFADYRFDRPDRARARRLSRLGVGGFCIFYGERAAMPGLANELQREAPRPLLLAADYEHGVGHQVSGSVVLPSNMALGATGSEALARLKGRATAREARALGVPWVLAPVVDVNANPRNPIINTRSFGEDAALVTRLARAYAEGLREGGALSCAKHFPGHGDVTQDSHIELPVVERSLETIRATELVPYQSIGADAVMVAHLVVKAIDPERPASLSPRAIELLRGECGFQGLVCTDALMMGGITKFCSEDEAIVRAAAAGCDVLLYPEDPERAIDTLERAVREGRVSEAHVARAQSRIDALIARAGVDRERFVAETLPPPDEGPADEIAAAALTLVKGELPRGPVAFAKLADPSARGDLSVFERALALPRAEDAASCVVAVYFKQKAFAGKTGLDASLVERFAALRARHRHLTVVSFGSPYVIHDLPPVETK